jgi:RimJ/RimL family protein N-acetyltransferase
LILRHITTDDAEVMLELLNEPAFIRFVADRGVRTISQAAEFIAAKLLPSYAEFGFGFYLVELKGSQIPVGICGLVKRETLDDVDVGFSILERFWRNGYAYEAAQAVMDYGKSVLGIPRIIAVTAPDNETSGKLLEKLGLRFEKMIHLPGYGAESKLFG